MTVSYFAKVLLEHCDRSVDIFGHMLSTHPWDSCLVKETVTVHLLPLISANAIGKLASFVKQVFFFVAEILVELYVGSGEWVIQVGFPNNLFIHLCALIRIEEPFDIARESFTGSCNISVEVEVVEVVDSVDCMWHIGDTFPV